MRRAEFEIPLVTGLRPDELGDVLDHVEKIIVGVHGETIGCSLAFGRREYLSR